MEPVITQDFRDRAVDDHSGDGANRIGDLFSKLTTDVASLVTMRVDLLKAEMRDGTKTLVRDSALMIAGGVLGLFALLAGTLALIALIAAFLPFDDFYSAAAGAGIVMLVYAAIAGALIMMGQKHLKEKGLQPERSIEEIKKDKELVRELRK